MFIFLLVGVRKLSLRALACLAYNTKVRLATRGRDLNRWDHVSRRDSRRLERKKIKENKKGKKKWWVCLYVLSVESYGGRVYRNNGRDSCCRSTPRPAPPRHHSKLKTCPPPQSVPRTWMKKVDWLVSVKWNSENGKTAAKHVYIGRVFYFAVLCATI